MYRTSDPDGEAGEIRSSVWATNILYNNIDLSEQSTCIIPVKYLERQVEVGFHIEHA